MIDDETGSTDGNGDTARDGDALACRRFRVRGRVQGVFFRASAQTVARDLGVGGCAKNCSDGSVEILASGPPPALDALERWLHEGPAMANVESVVSTAEAFQEMDDFTIA